MYINVINEHDMKIAVINSKDFYDLRTRLAGEVLNNEKNIFFLSDIKRLLRS